MISCQEVFGKKMQYLGLSKFSDKHYKIIKAQVTARKIHLLYWSRPYHYLLFLWISKLTTS